jgi:hypothetical protein
MTQSRVTTGLHMLAVVLITLGFGACAWLLRRSAAFESEAFRHVVAWRTHAGVPAASGGSRRPESPRADYHTAMARKYRHAADCPWLRVDPDPPEPED